MNQEEFRRGMNKARNAGGLFIVLVEGQQAIAVGYDSGRDVAVLHDKREVPLVDVTDPGLD